MANCTSHSDEAKAWIGEQMKKIGVDDYCFCSENDSYVCDRFGNFFSVCHRQYSKSGKYIEKYRIQKLRGSTDRYGYTTYRILVDGERKHLKAHRMVLNAWLGEQPDLVVNHKDGNKQNNALVNLEWCTVAENNAHAIQTGLFDPHARTKFDYAVPPSEWTSIYILYKHCRYSLSELGRMNGCVHDTIKTIIRRMDAVFKGADAYAS